MNRINLVMLLDKLEEIVSEATEIPLTGRVLLDSDELLDLIDKIRNSIPEEVKRAEMVSTEKDRVISEGQQRAERMIAQAEEYAARLIQENEITRQAREEADRLLTDAREEAEEMQRGAKDYAMSILDELDQSLQKTLSVVAKGKDNLQDDDQ